MPFAVNIEDTTLYKQYEDAAKRLTTVIDKAADLGKAEQQYPYVKLCEMVAAGLQGPAGKRLIQALVEQQLKGG